MKEEEESKLKSSKEILTELFDKFNATPPRSPIQVDINEVSSKTVESHSNRKKKKKKEKKSKRDKHSKRDVDSKKSRKKKKKKRRSESSSSRERNSKDRRSDKVIIKSEKVIATKESHCFKTEKIIEPKTPVIVKKENSDENSLKDVTESSEASGSCLIKDSYKSLPDVIPSEIHLPNNIINDSLSNNVSQNSSKIANIIENKTNIKPETFSSPSQDKPKAGIKISNLKNSTILEAAEEVAKQKAEKYEDGELSETSSSDSSYENKNIDVEKSCKHRDKKREHSEKRKKHKHHKYHKKKKRSKSPVRIVRRVVRRSRSGSRTSKLEKEEVRNDQRNSRESKERKRSRTRQKDSRSDKSEFSKDSVSKDDKKDDDRKSHKDVKKDSSKKRDERSRDRSRERRKGRSKSPLELPSMMISKKSKRSRSRSRTRGLEIDKKKLLEIARKNALNMMKQGISTDQGKVATLTAGGKTVDELTDFCKLLSQKEGTEEVESLSPLSNSSDSEGEKPFHHPFLIKDRPTNIVMNIRNCASLPVKTHQEKTAENAQQLRIQFPVSSGQQHRKTESEWVPVSPKKDEAKPVVITKPPIEKPKKPPQILAIEPPPLPPPELTNVFPIVEEKYDIGEMVGMRLNAMKRLEENPSDIVAHQLLREAEEKMSRWRDSQLQPGLFTGSTNVRLLTPAELAAGAQAWARKDQLMCAQPVTGGMGMSLLQKMGWKPGEGLGKNHEGTLEPLSLPVKMDKRGLVCAEELKKPVKFLPQRPLKKTSSSKPTKPVGENIVKSIEGKHPVSMLIEYCTKKHIHPPVFSVCFESGPSHKRVFLFKVEVNGMEYKASLPSPNKKQAKMEAALACLKTLGLVVSVTASNAISQEV